MDVVVGLLLAIAAIIHLLPVVGVFGKSWVERLYGIGFEGPDLAILLRHRAVLFGLLGLLLAAAIWDENLRPAALIGGLVSDLAFLLVAGTHRGMNAAMRRVVVMDVISVVALISAAGTVLASR